MFATLRMAVTLPSKVVKQSNLLAKTIAVAPLNILQRVADRLLQDSGKVAYVRLQQNLTWWPFIQQPQQFLRVMTISHRMSTVTDGPHTRAVRFVAGGN